MKVLIVAPHITNEAHPQFLKNQTGLGRIINDMASYIGKYESVDVFTLSAMTPTLKMDGFNVVGRKWLKVICEAKPHLLLDYYKFKRIYGIRSIRVLYYFISLGQVENILSKYDLVHLHGCTSITYEMIKICKKHHKPFLVTLHGLISFGGEQTNSAGMMRLERDFLKFAYKDNLPVNFISTGNKLTACNYIGVDEVSNFYVVTNGCNIHCHETGGNIREKYGLRKHDFVISYVANICENKNQNQVVESFKLIDEETRRNIKVLFVGRDGDELKQKILNYGLEKSLIVCGGVPRKNVGDYYMASDATILTSHSEGFGLSIIEGYVYGKPCLTFADMPAVADLFHEKAMMTMPNRKDETLAQGICQMASHCWDGEWIKEYSYKFSLENMANKYTNLYKKVINEHQIQ